MNGLSVADASHQLRLHLTTLAWAVRQLIQGVIGDMQVMAEWREDNVLEVASDDAEDDDRSNPTGLYALLAELQTLLGRATFDGSTPDVHALATRLVADAKDFEWLRGRFEAITTGFEDRLAEQQHSLKRTLAVVNTTRDISFAGAIAIAVVVAAPAGAAYGLAGQAGASIAGGALVGGGLHAADRTDSKPLLDRTLGGMEEGALMGASGMAGQAAGATVSTALRPIAAASPFGEAVSSTLTGAVDTAVASGSYTTGAALARGDGISAAASQGLEIAAETAPFGAALGYAARAAHAAPAVGERPVDEAGAGAKPRDDGEVNGTGTKSKVRDEVDQRIEAAPPKEQETLRRVIALDDATGRRLIREYGDELIEYLHTNPLTTLDEC